MVILEGQRGGPACTPAAIVVFIELRPAKERQIELHSPIAAQYGQAMEASIRDVLESYAVADCQVIVHDHGALDCTLRARLITALERSFDDAL